MLCHLNAKNIFIKNASNCQIMIAYYKPKVIEN